MCITRASEAPALTSPPESSALQSRNQGRTMDVPATDSAADQLGAGLRDLVAGLANRRGDLAATPRPMHTEPHGDIDQQCAEALARVHGASDFLKFTLQRIDELEARGREMAEASARRIESLERAAADAERRADEEEREAREAEEWLRRVHGAV